MICNYRTVQRGWGGQHCCVVFGRSCVQISPSPSKKKRQSQATTTSFNIISNSAFIYHPVLDFSFLRYGYLVCYAVQFGDSDVSEKHTASIFRDEDGDLLFQSWRERRYIPSATRGCRLVCEEKTRKLVWDGRQPGLLLSGAAEVREQFGNPE
jgi:hypothetical protein